MTMTTGEFHAYMIEVAYHMNGWNYLDRDNSRDGELRSCVTLSHANSSAKLWFSHDAYRGKIVAKVERSRLIGSRNEYLANDGKYDAKAGFSQGRDPKAVARAVYAKLGSVAVMAAGELDLIEQQHADSQASQAATIKALNASGLLSSKLEASTNDRRHAYFYTDGTSGQVDEHGSVRIDLRGLSAEKAVAVLALLAS